MLRWFAKRRINAFERAFHYDASYMHEMMAVSWPGFRRFLKATELAAHREDVPPEAWHAARIAATLSEDCGPCTQLMVQMAEMEGIAPSILQGILTGDEKAMGPTATLALQFALAVLARDSRADSLREQIATRWGQRAVLSLALAMTGTRLYPAVKYALGHGQACAMIKVGDKETRPQALPIAA